MQLYNIDGHYQISFFNIVIEANGDVNQIKNENPSTFTHEFVHFLQDLILPYCIRVNLSQLRWFTDIANHIKENASIKLPFDAWSRESETMKIQFDYTFGKLINDESIWDTGSVQSELITRSGFDASHTQMYRTFDIYKYSLKYNKYKNYHFGAQDLLEYIAYKIEVKHFKTDNFPKFPYKTIDLLFDMHGFEYLEENLRLCISEFCLYNDNPVHTLFVKFLKNDEFKLRSTQLTYEELYKELLRDGFISKDRVQELVLMKTFRRLEQFSNDLSIVYGGFYDIQKWIRTVNLYLKTNFLERFIFSDMYSMNTESLNVLIDSIINAIGIPLIMNKNEVYISAFGENQETSQFVQFYIMQKFINYVKETHKNTECPICNFCKVNFQKDYNTCEKRNNSIDSNTKCQYYKFLDMYGLTDITA